MKGIQGSKLIDEVFDFRIDDQVFRGRFQYSAKNNLSIVYFDRIIFVFMNGEVLFISNGEVIKSIGSHYEKIFFFSVETWCKHIKLHKEEKGNYGKTEFKDGEFNIIFDYQIKPFKLVKVSYILNT